MNDQERLQEIEEIQDQIVEAYEEGDPKMVLHDLLAKLFTKEHTDWLIQQAKRNIYAWNKVRELEAELSGEKVKVSILEDRKLADRESYENLRTENQRYKQALEFYADKKNHTEARGTQIFGDVFYDEGNIARQALEGESE